MAELRRGQGVSDWLDTGHTVDELREIADLTHPVGLSLAPCPWIDEATIPPRTWLYPPHYIRKFISLLISTGGIGKSSLAIVEALAMVSGKPLLGITPAGPMRALVWNGEDPPKSCTDGSPQPSSTMYREQFWPFFAANSGDTCRLGRRRF